MSHTPGPWRAAIEPNGLPIAGECPDEMACVEHVQYDAIAIFVPEGDVSVNLCPLEEHLANARVMAAAPDLLAAAKLTALCFQRHQASINLNATDVFLGDDEHEAWSALEKAIAKAEGR